MSNDFLIDKLVGDLRPVKPQNSTRQAAVLFCLAAIELSGFLALGRLRPDISGAFTRVTFWWKMGGLAVLAVSGVAIALRSFTPVSAPRSGLRRWSMVFAGLVLAGWVMAASGQDLAGLGSRLMWQMGLQCFALTTLCSIPPVIALGIMMRHGAPTDQPASALAVGAAAATWGAFIFAFHCPSDDPFYIVFWYSLACSTIIWLARLILPLISRW